MNMTDEVTSETEKDAWLASDVVDYEANLSDELTYIEASTI